MSDSNRTKLSYAREVQGQWGQIPSNPVFNEMRNTSSGLSASPTYVSSEEIRADRQIPDVILTNLEASGDTGHEVSYGAYDEIFEGAFFNAWDNVAEVSNTGAGTPITVSTAYDISGGTEPFLPGSIVIASGFAEAANNQTFVADAGTSGTTVESPNSLTAEASPAAGAKLKVVGHQATSGDVEIDGSGYLISTTLDFTTLGIAVGDWIKIGGAQTAEQFATAANNGFARVSAISANEVQFDRGADNFATDNGAGKTIRIFLGDKLINGVTEYSYTLERQFQSHSPVTYQYFRGMEVSELAFSLESNSIMTFSSTWSGRDSILGADGNTPSLRPAGVSDVDSLQEQVMNTSSNVARIGVGGVEVTGANFVLSATLTVNNNLRMQNAVSNLGAIGIGNGTCEVTGEISTYFDDPTLYTQALKATESSLDLTFQDPQGNAYVLDVPSLRFSGGDPTVEGINSDVTLPLSITAFRNTDLGYTVAMQRFTTEGLI